MAALPLRSVSQPGIIGLQSPKPVGHMPTAHVPAEQIEPVPAHACPQLPQFMVETAVFVSQPLVVLLSQSAKPGAHAPSAQAPAVHAAVALE